MDAKVFTKALEGLSCKDQAKVMAYISTLQGQADVDKIKLESEAVLNTTIQSLPFDVWITDTSFRLIAVNKTTAQKLQQELKIVAEPGHNLLAEIEAFSPQVAPFWRKVLHGALEGEVFQKEYNLTSLDECNRIHYLESIIGPYYDSAGNIIGCIGSTRDITEIKLQQNATQEREQIYKTIIQHARAGIDIIDITNFDGKNHLTAKLFDRNSKMEKYLQSEKDLFITKAEIRAAFDNLQFDGRTSDQIYDQLFQKMLENESYREVFRLKTQSGKYHDIDALLWVINVNGKILFIRFFRDVTEELHKKRLIDNQLNELHQQNATLQRYIASNSQLENFAYIAAHDLQAPIRSIASFINVLERSLKDKINDQEKEYLDFVTASAKGMQLLIGDLLEYSRANTEKRKLNEISLSNVKKEVESNLSRDLQENKVILNWELDSDKIIADHTKLLQVLENLVNNAIKFVPPERIPKITVRLKDQPDQWQFEVKDNGLGIEKEFHEQIFTLFRRLHGQDKYKGTGIGLALCKQLVEEHDGTIGLESSLGNGSTFYFTIPKNLQD